MIKRWFRKYKYFFFSTTALLALVYYFILPKSLFNDPYSTLLEDRNFDMLGATIASDGQWRFPGSGNVPDKFAKAIISFEDKRFHQHIGFDPISTGRALWQNIRAGRVVSGGSTISMQVIRLSRKGKPRTFLEKALEMVLATRLELRYSKKEILALYASHAPFGGNIVGLDAATWRYFGRPPSQLSWGEAAVLAVLPNSPALIHPGRNRLKLKEKRNRLLDKLLRQGIIDSLTNQLSKSEPLPNKPLPLPEHAPHLLTRAISDGYGQKRVHTTLKLPLQQKANAILRRHALHLQANEIYNAAAMVLDLNSGQVVAYVGNISGTKNGEHGADVDIITASRSTGSLLKPFLYAAMIDDGKMLPKSLVADVPIFLKGFSPKNFTKTYDGAVSANRALARSLNVPAVNMLQAYRYERFHTLLKTLGMKTLNRPPGHYGLSLILGGAEGSLWELTGMYAGMGRVLNYHAKSVGSMKYNKQSYHAPSYIMTSDSTKKMPQRDGVLSAASIWETFQALLEVYRPADESSWQLFSTSKKIAWKTGTSFGHRDAWAIGINPRYAVGVWVGNADGEGRPGLTGVSTAAPILFDLFRVLPGNDWFQQPKTEFIEKSICKISGFISSPNCTGQTVTLIPRSGLKTSICPFHKTVHLNITGKYRVNSECESVDNMIHKGWFILPPVQEYYYKSKNASYIPLPPFRDDCEQQDDRTSPMQVMYPKKRAKIFVPIELDGSPGEALIEVAHRNPSTIIYWHLDDQYIGMTKHLHQMGIHPPKGMHKLTLIDDNGRLLEHPFEIISK